MKMDKTLYERTFSHLKASPALREELLTMTEQSKGTRKPKKFILRRLAIVAAVMALAAALAMGANAATNGELYEATFGKLIASFSADDGMEIQLYGRTNDDGTTTFFAMDSVRELDDEGEQSLPDDGEVRTEAAVTVEVDEEGNFSVMKEENGEVSEISLPQE